MMMPNCCKAAQLLSVRHCCAGPYLLWGFFPKGVPAFPPERYHHRAKPRRWPRPMSTATQAPSCQRQSGTPVALRMYAVDRGRLDTHLAATFVQSRRDNATDRFLADANLDRCNKSKLRQHHQDYLRFRAAQRQGMSRTDASAAHLRVTLLLASTEQFRRVLAPARASAPPAALLDVGAGRGEATAALASAIGGMPIYGSNPRLV